MVDKIKFLIRALLPEGAERPRGMRLPSTPDSSWMGFGLWVGPRNRIYLDAFLTDFWQEALRRGIEIGEIGPNAIFSADLAEDRTGKGELIDCFVFLVAIDWMVYNSLLVSNDADVKELLKKAGVLPKLKAAAKVALRRATICLN